MSTPTQRAALYPERLRFESEVAARDGQTLELEETYFFARSGGQPADRGQLAGENVIDVRKDDGRTVHELAEPPDVSIGDRVEGMIDGAHRTYCRRAHTASHVVYGAARREFENLGYGGFGIDERKVRIDLAAASTVDEGTLIRLERLANEAVWAGRDVTWYELPLDEARQEDRIAFNVATAEGVFVEADTVRIVEVEGWDIAACGGTHLRSTVEIGPIWMLDRSNPGEGLTRIEFAVGPIAIRRQAMIHAAARNAARELDVPPESLVETVQKREADAAAQADRIARLEESLLVERIDRLAANTIEIDGAAWVVGEIPPIDGNVISTVVRDRVENGEIDVIVAVSGAEQSSLAVGANETTDAGEFVAEITDKFGGGGGGGAAFAQGGGIPASTAAIIDHVRETYGDG